MGQEASGSIYYMQMWQQRKGTRPDLYNKEDSAIEAVTRNLDGRGMTCVLLSIKVFAIVQVVIVSHAQCLRL
jgi:hypothetical protein